MIHQQLTLAYSSENAQAAATIEQQLRQAGYAFQHIVNNKEQDRQSLFERLEGAEGKVVVLISDNFLKSTTCMNGALRFFQNNVNRVLPVVVEGTAIDEATGATVAVPAHFERVSDIIQYINHWQDRYLDVRRQKRHLEGIDEEGFNAHLKVMRDISSEIGEFLRWLRSAEYVSLSDLQSSNYERFFRFTGDEDKLWNFRTPSDAAASAPPQPEPMVLEDASDLPDIDLSDIPGISLLPAEPMAEPEAETVLPAEEVHQPEAGPDADSTETTPSETEMPAAPEVIGEAPVSDEPAIEESPAALPIYNEDTKLQEPETRNPEPGTRNPEPETRNPEPETRNPEPETPDALLRMGADAEFHGDFAAARAAYTQLTQADPGHADAWFRLGALLAEHYPGEEAAAAGCFETAIQLAPSDAEAYYQYGVLMTEVADNESAGAAFRTALQLQPNHPFVWYDLALLYHRLGAPEDAYVAYQNAIINNPELKTPQNDMAFEYLRSTHTAKAAEIIEQEQTALAEMRENLNRLEALLKEREEELQRLTARPVSDQTVFITGATSGIGKATAVKFAQNGFRLILCGRRAERLEEIKSQLETEFGTQVHVFVLDVRDAAAVQQAVDNLPAEWADIDILVNNAGKAKGFDFIHEGSLEHWDEMIDTNLKGLLYVTRAVSPRMVARRKGFIINIGSTAGKEVYPKGNVYCASKFAVDALTKAMRFDLHTHNIRVGQVSPGHVEETEFAVVRFDGDAERAKIYNDFKPLTSADVAEAIYFMATQPPHVNIQDILMLGTQQAGNMLIDRSGRHD